MASAATTAQSLKQTNRQPPPENIRIPSSTAASPELSQSPSPTILRDFDRYPNNYSSKTVSMIMNSRVEPSAILDAKVDDDDRSMKAKLANGKISISQPEGFTHVAHQDHSKDAPRHPARGPPVRSYRDSKQQQQPSHNSAASSWRFSSRTSSATPKENRKSRLPWRRQASAQPQADRAPSISEPILEYSTSELVPETSRQQRSSVSSSSKHSRDSVQSPVASERSFEDPRSHHHHQSPQQLTTNDILEIHKWRQRLRESEDQRRSMVIEYQQKLDAERQKNLELTKKLEEMKLSTQTKTKEVVKPASDSEVQARIKALESQRDVLREALNTLRQTKELEMSEYKMQQHKKTHTYNRFSNSSKGTLVDDRKLDTTPSSSSSSTVSSPEQHFVYRTGIRPLLPTANPVEMP